MNKVVRKIEMPVALDAAVHRMARDTKRTPSEVVLDAVEQMLADADDLAIDIARWKEFERTGESVSLEDATKRLKKRLNAARRRRSTSKA